MASIGTHSMRAYYVPAVAGLLLIVSAFLPWVVIGNDSLGGVPELAGLWVLGLGIAAVVLAALSIVTRKNSRHPLLMVGLLALGIMFLAALVMTRTASEQAWAETQARAIVDGEELPQAQPAVGSGVYIGITASFVLVLFGLTIVVKRVATPYAAAEDGDD
jgi:hypothetical protein